MANKDTMVTFCEGISNFLGSADLSDFTITCGGHKWPVHRLCLSLHSSVLAKACNGDFKEGQQKTYDFSEYPKETVAALVRYLYNFDYEVHGEEHGQRMCFHVALAIMADKYDIPGLKTLATEKFQATVDETQHAAELAEVAIVAYGAEAATKDICKAIATQLVKHESSLPGREEGEPIETVLQDYPQLAVEIIKLMRPKVSEYPRPPECVEKIYTCPMGCGAKLKAYIPNNKGDYTCPKCGQDRWGQNWARCVQSS